MDETLTPAERLRVLGVAMESRARLDAEAPYSYSGDQRAEILRLGAVNRETCEAGADALDRLAQTCATCQHADTADYPDGWCICAAPTGSVFFNSEFPFKDHAVPLDERCKGWAKRENA